MIWYSYHLLISGFRDVQARTRAKRFRIGWRLRIQRSRTRYGRWWWRRIARLRAPSRTLIGRLQFQKHRTPWRPQGRTHQETSGQRGDQDTRHWEQQTLPVAYKSRCGVQASRSTWNQQGKLFGLDQFQRTFSQREEHLPRFKGMALHHCWRRWHQLLPKLSG